MLSTYPTNKMSENLRWGSEYTIITHPLAWSFASNPEAPGIIQDRRVFHDEPSAKPTTWVEAWIENRPHLIKIGDFSITASRSRSK